jgi:hypothetical protein
VFFLYFFLLRAFAVIRFFVIFAVGPGIAGRLAFFPLRLFPRAQSPRRVRPGIAAGGGFVPPRALLMTFAYAPSCFVAVGVYGC